MKKVISVHSPPSLHWVGDGFPVRSLFSYNDRALELSPFLLLDYAGPAVFAPSDLRRGVGEHPHRGFETVTLVYQGEVEHRDSTGSGGRIGPGDAQWMTAGSGILHEEFHSSAFSEQGGTLEMVQLWVNLPAKDKMVPPRYQTLLRRQTPVVELALGAGTLRVLAGEFGGARGPARTYSPVDVWDLRLAPGKVVNLEFSEGRTLVLVVLRGTVEVNGESQARATQWVQFAAPGTRVAVEANAEATVLVLSGEPLGEPVVGHGPFVMNTRQEIADAMDDFRNGRLGRIPPAGD